MNYRELKQFLEQYTDQVRKIKSELERASRNYSEFHSFSSELRNILIKKIKAELTISDAPEVLLAHWKSALDLPLVHVSDVYNQAIENRGKIITKIKSLPSVEELSSDLRNAKKELKSLEDELTAIELKESEKDLYEAVTILNKISPSDEEYTRAKNSGFIRLLFSAKTSELRQSISAFESALQASLLLVTDTSARNHIDKSHYAKDSSWSEVLLALESIKSHCSSVTNRHSQIQNRKQIIDESIKNIEDLNSKLNLISDTALIRSMQDMLLNREINDNNLAAITGKLNFQSDYQALIEASARSIAAKEIQSGLAKQVSNLDKVIRDLTKDEYKLRKAASQAGSKTVKNFDQHQFKKQMDGLFKSMNSSIQWSNRRASDLRTAPFHDGLDIASPMLLLYLFSIQDGIDPAGGFMLMPDVVADLQNQFTELESIHLNNLDTDGLFNGSGSLFSTSELQDMLIAPDMDNFNIPDISTPSIEIDFNRDYGGTYSDSGSSNFGD